MLNWLPVPQNFRAQLQAASRVPEADVRLERLTALAQHQLGIVETIQLDRALEGFRNIIPSTASRVRLAILASSTVDHLIPAIRVAGLRRRLFIDVHVGGYGQYRQDLFDTSSPLHEFAPQVVLFTVSAREALAGIQLGASDEEARDAIARYVDDLRSLWRQARNAFQATVVQQTFLDVTDSVFGSFDRCVSASPAQLVAQLNNQVGLAAASDRALIVDVARASERDGRGVWFDKARWFQAKQEIAPQAAPMFGELVVRVLAAQRGLSKKCLVLDLDNTLWHGVIGDDGLEGIVVGEGTAVGEAHLALQRYAKQLSARGVILAVCSKNDLATAEEVFEKHPDMILKRSDFAAFFANWTDKAENLKAIATQLNIGIDTLVFVDDNPMERCRIRQALPMVGVPELPDDVTDYVRCLAEAGYFEAVAFTEEDQQRGAHYSENVEREALRGSMENMDDFLRHLEMSVNSGPFTPANIGRVTQLINKTNQFHLTSRRYTLDEVSRFAAAPDCLTLQFRLADRFGDNGIVSAMILLPEEKEHDVLVIDTWVMSCRVFGRQLEAEAMNVAVEKAQEKGVREIRGEYIPSAKNSVVRRLFEHLGFAAETPEVSLNGKTRWHLKLADYTPKETRISRISE